MSTVSRNNYTCIIVISHYTAVTIGFENTEYESTEDDSTTQEVCAEVMGPIELAPGRSIEVTLTSMDETAMGKKNPYHTYGHTLILQSSSLQLLVTMIAKW